MILGYCKKHISYIVAAKAMKIPVVSWFAKKLQCIPVERP